MVKTSIHFLLLLVSTAILFLACNGGIGAGGVDPLDSSRAWGGASGPTYTVAYVSNVDTDGNGYSGSMPTDDGRYAQGQNVTVKGIGGFIYDGYTFMGWNTLADGTGTALAAGTTFSMGSANVLLYAQWSPSMYTVTYHGNGNAGGNPPVDENTYAWEGTATVLGNVNGLFAYANFVGWNTAADGSGTTWQPGLTMMMTANVDLYAIWYVGTVHTLTYDLNGGTGTVPVNANLYAPGQTVQVVPGQSLSGPEGKPFWLDWNTIPDGSGTTYLGAPSYTSTFVMGSADVILYAIYYVD